MAEHGCKVCRVLDERGMERYERRIVEQWRADRPRRKGYRQLATWLNVLMLRREMDRAGLPTLGEEPASKYDRLTADDTAVAAEVRDRLRDGGVDVDSLERDFVSYGVVRTHLKGCLELDRERESTEWEPRAIEITRSHAERKAEEAVRSLVNKGEIAAEGDVTVHVSVELECEECHARVPAERAIRRGYVCAER
ncbi:rod-determining factor RdfA [Halomarina halobia]|uniref:Rod-determining factor RdfA n=1 Tax=Halomarina halobia TaxID=3033386 RepID=A0ABD6ADQ6_9EURY|nr:rod-determining factor RdfA [Halomarina sp. PSR21]